MKTAIIGLGAIGGAIARNLTQGGVDVIVSERNAEKARAVAQSLGRPARALSIDEAVRTADVIILAIWFDAIKAFLSERRDELSGKIIVDPSNPIAPDGEGGFTKVIPQDQSSGRLVADLLPPDVKLLKAFGSLAATSLASAANRAPDEAVLFYATDYPDAGGVVAKLIEAAGFAPVDIGGIDQSVRIEVFGDLHEFGKLAKLVSAKEAEEVLRRDAKAAPAS